MCKSYSIKLIRIWMLLWFVVVVLSLTSFTDTNTGTNTAPMTVKSTMLEPALSETSGDHQSSLQTLPLYTVFLPAVLNQVDPPSFGVQLSFDIAPDAVGVQRMVDLQTVWARQTIRWDQIEPTDTTPDNYNWNAYDDQFLAASSNEIKIVATISYNPSWVAETGGGPVYPEHEDDLLEFVEALAERYDGDGDNDAPGSPKVLHWEFYNEPDNAGFFAANNGFGYWGHRGDEYAAFLAQVYPVIKGASPQASVLMGGIAHDLFRDEGIGSFERQFVDDFLAAGGGNYTDFFNFHYYPAFAYKWNPYGQGLLGKTNFLRDKMASYGVDKPIAITEIGITSDPADGGSDEIQSRYVLQVYSRALAADIKIVNWFLLKDFPPWWAYGLVDENFAPKPSYDVYKTLTTQLADVKYQRSLTTSKLGNSEAEGYLYQRGAEIVYVIWTNDDSLGQIQISANSITKISKEGFATTILDAADGAADGVVIVNYDGSPVYVIVSP